MKANILFVLLVAIMMLAGCKKDTDNAAQLVGTYMAIPGGGVTNGYVNQVVVQESNSSTLRMLFNNSSNNLVTYVTLKSVMLQNATSGTIGEADITLGVTDSVHYAGTVYLTGGDTLKVLCTATDSGGVFPYNFFGLKQ